MRIHRLELYYDFKNIKILEIRIRRIKNIPDEAKRVSNKCPAIIFAVKRIARVKRRIINLIDSIITINGNNIKGVLRGVKWANKLFK